MRAERRNRVAVLRIWIGIRWADDNDTERGILLAARWQHGRRERAAFAVAQRKEPGHGALHMRIEADVAFDEGSGRGPVVADGPLMLAPKVLLDRVPHDLGLDDRLALSLDPEPGFAFRRVAHVFHAREML